MEKDTLIHSFRDRLEQLQTALDESSFSHGIGACLPIEEWLRSAIAAYAKISDPSAAVSVSDLVTGPFSDIVGKAIIAMEKGISAEAFYDSMSSGVLSATDSGILLLAQKFCQNQGSDWDSVTAAIISGIFAGLPAVLASFAGIIAGNASQITLALEKAHNASQAVSDSERQLWYATMFACYCYSEQAVRTFVADELGKYFDRWRIGGSKERFPYAMNTIRYTWYRNHPKGENNHDPKLEGGGKADWDKLVKKLSLYDKEFFHYVNPTRYIVYNGQYCAVENGGYAKDGTKAGYSKDSSGEYVKLSGQKTYVPIKDIPVWYIKEGNEYKQTFDLQIYSDTNNDCNSRYGKGCPELMNFVASELKADGIAATKAYLAKFALGVDCSGFVSRAIVSVMISLQIPVPIQLETIGIGYGRLKTNATTLRDTGRDVLFSYDYLSKSKKAFKGGLIPKEPAGDFHRVFQPGDIIMKKTVKETKKGDLLVNDGFHIWIIKDASVNSFEVLQSTAAKKEGPRSDTYSSISGFTEKITLERTEKKGETYRTMLEFARPKVFSNMTELAEYYVNYLLKQNQNAAGFFL